MKLFNLAFLSAQKEFLPAVKDCVNPHFSSRYASLESILKSIQPALNKYGIFVSMPMHEDILSVRFVHAESNEFIEATSKIILSEKEMFNEQKRKSAITYQRRTLLEGLAGIVATDDDDANSAVHEPDSSQEEYLAKWNRAKEIAVTLGHYEVIKENIDKYKLEFNRVQKNFENDLDIRKFVDTLSFLRKK